MCGTSRPSPGRVMCRSWLCGSGEVRFAPDAGGRAADRLARHERSRDGPAGLLATVGGPQDLKRLTAEQLAVLAAEIRDFLVAKVVPHRRAPRPQPRRGRAHPGAAPGLRLARATGSCSTPATRRTCTRSSPAGRTASTSCASAAACPATRARPRASTTSIENSHASTALSYADGLAKAYALRGEDRHVVAVVGDGALTGGMCWEALNNIAAAEQPAGHRRQRQRPLVRADHRRPRRPPGHAAAQPGLREGARPGQGRARRDAAGRQAAVRGAARGQEGHQGRGRAAGDVRGPRHQVRRPGRRPRPARRWSRRCAGPRASAAR